MATGAAGSAPLSRNLMRQVRTGTSPTAGARLPAAAAGFAAAVAKIDLEGEHPAATSPSVSPVAPNVDPVTPPDARAEMKVVSPKSRFKMLKPEPSIEEGPAVVEPAPSGRFASMVDAGSTPGAKQARVNIAAVKALTPLVASISFSPGNAAEPTMKSAALANLIIKVQKAAGDIVLAMGPTISNVDWAKGQVMQILANVAAKQWEDHGKVDLDGAARQMISVLRNPSPEFQSALDAYSQADAYMEARTPDVAKARIAVSVSAAAWELYDWITRDSLRLKDQPSRVYSYERPVDQVIEILMGRVIDEARGMQIQISSTDLQVAHLQGSIRRLVQLVGAEYVTQTNAILAWIDSPDIETSERERRYRAAADQFETHVVPRIMEYVHVNFVGIEHRARKLLEDQDYEKTPQGNESRPAV